MVIRSLSNQNITVLNYCFDVLNDVQGCSPVASLPRNHKEIFIYPDHDSFFTKSFQVSEIAAC